MNIRPFTFIDLFAGIGGMRLAFESAGGSCIFSSEWDPAAQVTYAANFGETPHGDITKIDASAIPDFDVILAGFPCQPFSTIGKRAGFLHKTQGTLFYDVLRIVKEKRPRAFLLENVQGLVSHDSGKTFDLIISALEDANYAVQYRILDAADFGVPQSRKRIYIVGFRSDLDRSNCDFSWPEKHSQRVGVGRFIESGVEGFSISKKLQESYIFKVDDGRPQIVGPSSDHAVKTLVASYHKIQRLSGTFVNDGPTGLRLLTTNECKAIMGFPKNFVVPVSRTQMYRQMGNSVAVPVVAAIAVQIGITLSALEGEN